MIRARILAFCEKSPMSLTRLCDRCLRFISTLTFDKQPFFIKNPRIQRLSIRQSPLLAHKSCHKQALCKDNVLRWILGILFIVCHLHASDTILLLTDYHKSPPPDLQGFLVSEKLDGVRGIWNGKTLKTRGGRILTPPACFIKDFPPFALDGELWIERGSFEEVASITSTLCKDCACDTAHTQSKTNNLAPWQQSTWGKVRYYVFDVPDSGGQLGISPESSQPKHFRTLTQRLSVLESYLKQHPNTPILIIKQTPINSQKELFTLLDTLTKQGAEGLVLRKDAAPYERGRTSNALKLKRYDDAECKIIAHNPGKGKYRGMLGSITCEQEFAPAQSQQNKASKSTTAPQSVKKVLHFKIGSGFSDEQRQNPPPLGTIITYKHYGFTRNGIPRFAIFHRIYTP